MRFRAGIHRIHTFTGLTASLSSLGNIAWVRLNSEDVRFTIIPEHGTQVWAVLQISTIFDSTFTIESAAEKNTINLEVPLQLLHRALKSAQSASATSASIRLTKKDGVPLLSLTITTSSTLSSGSRPDSSQRATDADGYHDDESHVVDGGSGEERETVITMDVPVRVLSAASVAGLHEPICREPDVHIILPDLNRLKSISDRLTKLGLGGATTTTTGRFDASSGGFGGGTAPRGGGGGSASSAAAARLVLRANMHGCLSLGLETDHAHIQSLWTGLVNPELDPEHLAGGTHGIAEHPSTRMKALGDAQGISDKGWATVRVDGRDWGRVLGVGRLGGRVIACFCDENALILYVYLSNDYDSEESVITYYVASYSV